MSYVLGSQKMTSSFQLGKEAKKVSHITDEETV